LSDESVSDASRAQEFMNDRTEQMERGLITLADMAGYSAKVRAGLRPLGVVLNYSKR
jgi:hypothetical protein